MIRVDMKPKTNYMPPDQFNKILAAIPTLKIRKWHDEDIVMLFKICYWCGLRMGEGIRLSAEDFDLDSHEVFLGKTKGGDQDYASISPFFLPEITIYLKGKTGSLFPDLKYGTVIKWIYRLGKTLEITAWTTPQSKSGEKTKTHIFRKSIGKDMMWGTHDGRKAPLNVISEKLRHRGKNPLDATSQYLKLNIEGVKDWEYMKSDEQHQIDEP